MMLYYTIAIFLMTRKTNPQVTMRFEGTKQLQLCQGKVPAM